jgi:hypothetical protein
MINTLNNQPTGIITILLLLHSDDVNQIHLVQGRVQLRKWWAFGFHKRWRISWLPEWLFTSQQEFCSTESVSQLDCIKVWCEYMNMVKRMSLFEGTSRPHILAYQTCKTIYLFLFSCGSLTFLASASEAICFWGGIPVWWPIAED